MGSRRDQKKKTTATSKPQRLEEKVMEKSDFLLEIADAWTALDTATQNSFFEINIENLNIPSFSTIMELDLEGMPFGKNLESWLCYKCRENFLEKKVFLDHLSNHLQKWCAEYDESLEPINDSAVKALQYARWRPINAKPTKGKNCGTSDDRRRLHLLQEIKAKLKFLIARDCLSPSNVRVLKAAADIWLKNTSFVSILRYSDVHFSICCLDANDLKKVLVIIKDLVCATKLELNFRGDHSTICEEPPVIPKIFLSSDRSSFIVEKISFFKKTPLDGGKALITLSALDWVHWVFTRFSYEQRVLKWSKWKSQKEEKTMKIYEAIEAEKEVLRDAKQSLINVLSYSDDVNTLRGSGFNALLKLKEEPTKFKCEHMPNRITDILEVAENLDSEIKSKSEDTQTVSSYLHVSDESVELAINSAIQQSTMEFLEIQATIRGGLSKIEKLLGLTITTSRLDYTYIVHPLINSFVRGRMYDLVQRR